MVALGRFSHCDLQFSIVVLALLFGADSLRGWTGLNSKNPSCGGAPTVSEVVLATGFSMKQAEKTLNEMVDGFRCLRMKKNP
jgi:hypothetical protein